MIPVTAEDPAGRTALRLRRRHLSNHLTSSGERLMNTVNTQCRLAARPVDMPKASDWSIVEEPKPVAAEGEFVVTGRLPVDRPGDAHVDERRAAATCRRCEIGEVMRALGVGHVVESRHPGFVGRRRRVRDIRCSALCAVRRRRGQQNRHRLGAGNRVSGCPRHQRSDRVLRPARRRPARAGPNRAGLRSGRIGGQHRGTDRADQGLPSGRHRRWRGQMPLAGRGGRIRRRDRLQDRRPAQRAQDPRT